MDIRATILSSCAFGEAIRTRKILVPNLASPLRGAFANTRIGLPSAGFQRIIGLDPNPMRRRRHDQEGFRERVF